MTVSLDSEEYSILGRVFEEMDVSRSRLIRQAIRNLIDKYNNISVNRSRTSLAFSPNGFDDIRCKIDEILADLAGLDTSFVSELQQFAARTIRAEPRSVPSYNNKERR